MKKIILFILSFITISMAQSNLKFAGDIKSYQVFKNHVEFVLSNALFNIYIIKDNIARFRYTDKTQFSEAPSYAVTGTADSSVKFTFTDEGKDFRLSTNELEIEIFKSSCRISIYDKDENLINKDNDSFGVSFENSEVRCYKNCFTDEKFYGLGEKTGNLNKRSNQYTMWNTDHPAYTWVWDPLYVSIPFFIAESNKKAYGIFLDNTYKSYFNMGASNNRFYWFGAENGEMDYYFIYGPEIKKVISSYTLLTGRMQLPPLWSLGYQQSKWSYYPESTVRRIARTFREKKIPCDVIYLDIDYMNGYRVFTWDKDRFPNPEKMLNDLKEEGFKIIPIIDPGVKADSNYFAAKEGLAKNLFAKYPDGITYQGEVWPSWAYFPDFTNNNARDWWGEKLNMLLKQGVKGFWNDMNEPSVWGQAFPDLVMFDDNGFTATHKKIHNVYALEEAKATFDALQKYSPNERHFVLTRAGFAGIQRYAAVWTGDNVANEEHLKLACLMPQGLGLSGVSFVGSDVGGFIGIPSPRLYTRWMQIGAFTPFFRGHSALNQSDKEPWAFGGETENRVRDAISLRYKMLPFLYNEFHNSAITGLPIMRSMFLNYQDDDECYNDISQYQFMLGDNLLVAPVLSETSNYKTLYLPAGKWIDMRNQKIYNGKQWVTVDAPIEEIPFFLKQGGFIPLQETQQYVDEKKINQLEVIIFPASLPTPEGTGDQKNLRAGTSSYTLYEDDGISYNYRQGYYSLTEFTSTLTGNTGIINIYKTHNNYNPGRVYYLLKILNTQSVSKVTGNGRLLNRLMSESKLNDSEDGFYLDPLKNILFVKIKDVNDLEVKYDF